MNTPDLEQLSLTSVRTSRGDRVVALFYLVALSIAEMSMVLITPQFGLILHGVLLLALIRHVAALRHHTMYVLLLTLTFAPLSRLVSMSIWLVSFPLIYWYLFTSMPLLLAALLAARRLGRSWRELGVNLHRFPVQVLVGLSGLGLGYVEYALLKLPQPAGDTTWQQLWLPSLILMISTGVTEELIFRSLMQSAATAVLGRFGIIYVATLVATLQVGHWSPFYVLFAFTVALYFGWVTNATRSIAGVTLAHGLANIVAVLLLPLIPGMLTYVP